MTYQEIKQEESCYVMNTYGRYPVAPEKGKGARLWDVEGKEYIDMASGIGVNCLGYGDWDLVKAVSEQASKLMHVSNLYTTIPMVKTAKTLVIFSGLENGKVFFANSGAEANEGAIKLARKYSFDRYGEGRSKIITLKNSFHGRTVTTLKATGQDKFHQYFFPFTEGFDYAEPGDLEDLKNKADDTACAVMMELVQGEGGVLPLNMEYVQAVERFCRERDLLLIVDEVQTGIGRTGSLFCFQQYKIRPDVVTLAKGLGGGLPIGAVLAAGSCSQVLGPGTHASTFGGSPTVCAAANAVLAKVNDPIFLEKVRSKGDYIRRNILDLHAPAVKAVRGMGLMIGIQVEEGKQGEYVNALMEKGVLALTAGKDTVRLLPPLTITIEEIDQALAAMSQVFGAE